MGDLKIKSEETGRTATFKNILYVPTLKKTLVSISRINRQSGDASLVFDKNHCQLRNKNKLSITARWNDSYLYAIQGKFILPGMDDEANTTEAADAMLWHALTKEDVDMDLANTQPPPQRPVSSMTSERGKSPSSRKSSPARLMAQPFAHCPPQVTRHDTRNSRRAAEAATEAAAATAPTHEEGPRESRWDQSHRPSNKKKSTSPGRTKQAAVEGMDAARHQARATTVDSKRSTSRNAKVCASATTAQPTRKAGDRGQSPHKTMRTEDTRGVATKLPWQHPIDRDDPPDAANAAYDVCFNATDVDEDVPATFHEAMHALLWCQHFKAILEALDFAATLSDSCVFTRRADGRLQIVTITWTTC
ncbi:hypothetical protein DYB30_004314 [Aphanomyces astaci]|uniref:Reverse transcriptase Ty1/copia-type domain-containing protein n=1 Tax=Aphanomyces astaci TaxID=112090 RepID=A0A397DJL3_APHAT|nr:hypothetical protein DYB30_004314 [Aphanomyces astaci]